MRRSACYRRKCGEQLRMVQLNLANELDPEDEEALLEGDD
jgi:hypothetical protein